MNIAIDIGNTRTKVGIFNKTNIEQIYTFENTNKIEINEAFEAFKIEKSIISTTSNISNIIKNKLQYYLDNLVFIP